jgi:tetratricopeptide (TPR) repeat protein
MRFSSVLLCGSMFLFAPMPAMAGEQVLRAPAPAWVDEATLEATDAKNGPPELLADWQHRIEGGIVYSYHDRAVRIDNPQTLMDENILSLAWLPDKGDLTVHRLEILRAGKIVDVLGDGAKFDVIRREQGLEARLLDGELTATLAIPGLKVGDVLRVAYTTSTDDQALGDEVQVLQYLGSKPWRVGKGRAVVSWPQDEEMFWAAEDLAGLKAPEVRDGYEYLTVELPLAERKDVPRDAPGRYQRPTFLRVGSYSGWNELSQKMATHYISAAQVGKDSQVARQAAAIMKAVADPLERTERAVRLVQDDVSYLLNGLDGGNYLPQHASETWEKRYGDCKAKSVLLLALLREMGIDAEPALVASETGDSLPHVLPLPGDFDHVIVHARIDGTDYWLDGTSAGTRLNNIANVPPFHYALPLRTGGSDLVPMVQHERTQPDMNLAATVDHSAGIDFPQLFTVTVDVSGPPSASVRSMADLNDPEMLRQMAARFADSSNLDGGVISSIAISYDEEAASGRIVVHGLGPSEFQWENGRLVMPVDDTAADYMFNPDRARPEWRDIPVATAGPFFLHMQQTMTLPQGGKNFSLKGSVELDGGFANTRLVSSARLVGAEFSFQADVHQSLGEIAPSDVPEAKRQARRFAANTIELVAPSEVTWRWDLDEKQLREKTARIAAEYDNAIKFAAEDDFGPLEQKAAFLQSVYDYAGALATYDRLLKVAPSANLYLQRSSVHSALGGRKEAIADLQQAYDIDPSNYTGFALAHEMAYAGQIDEAIELLESLPVADEERPRYSDVRATVSGLEGDTTSGLSLLAEEVAEQPENGELLNSDCWFRGLFNIDLDGAVAGCTRAVERAEYPASALDSRAMVQFRLGHYEAALADLDAALVLTPALAPSRYLRGVVRLKTGDAAGRADIAAALRMAPQLAEFYARHGVSPDS